MKRGRRGKQQTCQEVKKGSDPLIAKQAEGQTTAKLEWDRETMLQGVRKENQIYSSWMN